MTSAKLTSFKPLKIVGWTVAVLLLVIAALIVFILTFDWNRARPYINRKVSESTGRDFAIEGDLRVKFRQGLQTEPGWRRYVPRPEISAGNVRMSNPTWSSVGPQMAAAQRIDISMHLLPLLHKQVVLTDLGLVAPVVALQRREDGSNTWTFHPDKKDEPSEWSVEIQRMAFANGNLRYLDEGIGLDLRAKVASIAGDAGGAGKAAPASAPAADNAAPPVQKFGLQFELGGSYHKAPVSGSGKAGAVLSLQDERTVYPVQADAKIGANKISVDGTLTDPRSLSGIDLKLSLAGDSMAALFPLTGVLLPETPAYATHGRLSGKKNGESWTWTYEDFKGTVGGSDLAGTLQYTPRKPRPFLTGSLTSQSLRLEDLGPSVGADSNAKKEARGKAPVQPEGKALPVEQFNTKAWGALDAEVKFSGKKIVRTHDIPLQNIVTEIRMKDKVLSLTPLNFGLAGGTVTSNITLDGRKDNIAAQIKMAARHLKIRELFPKLQSMQASFGEVNGDAALTGHGNSVSSMLATSNGELGAVVTEGSVSQFVLELAGLNVANAVFAKVFGDKQIHLNCMASDFGVNNGKAGVRRFVLDTDDAVVNITGDIELAQEKLNLDIRPQTKGARIFSLRTPLYAKGTFKDPDVGPYKGPIALKGAAAVALAAINPLAAALPLVNMGKTPDTDCAAALSKVTQTRAASRSQPAAPAKPVTEGQAADAQRRR
jgi:uncharacterized protein involved in outer membrane biogenesis